MSDQEYQAISGRKGGLSRTINQCKKEMKQVPDQVTTDYEEATKALEKMKSDKVKAKAPKKEKRSPEKRPASSSSAEITSNKRIKTDTQAKGDTKTKTDAPAQDPLRQR